jgi:hypothetical protein
MLITDEANVPVKKSVKHLDSCRFRTSDDNRDTNGKCINKAHTHTHTHNQTNLTPHYLAFNHSTVP